MRGRIEGRGPEGLPPERIKGIRRRIDDDPLFGADLAALARWMADTYYSSEGESLCGILPGGRRESEFPPTGLDEVDILPKPLTLSGEQEAALEAITASKEPFHYLYGITGSGKTEVFLHAASRSLEEGLGVIYLVPEIALTGQVMDAVRARFGDKAAILHSGLSPSQRLGEWRRVMAGQASVVVGARSAVFAPVPRLGLVVIDEEHEGSYKSGSSPRYHARQVAMRRVMDARAAGMPARLVMGSATPPPRPGPSCRRPARAPQPDPAPGRGALPSCASSP
jgi:primosomal protein N' (replication factor Y)